MPDNNPHPESRWTHAVTATEAPITWAELAVLSPDLTQLVQWIVQTHGPLPDGKVQQVDYERYKALYEKAMDQ